MTLMSEITRVSNNIAAAYTALDEKGATLPAEGSQNSANLADTIDTITTGGGASVRRGDWLVPPEYVAFDELVKSTVQGINENYSAIGVYLNRSILTSGKYYFDGSSDIDVYTSSGLKTLEDVTLQGLYGTYKQITLSADENYIIFIKKSTSSSFSDLKYIIVTYQETYFNEQQRAVEYANVYNPMTGNYSAINFSGTMGMLENIKEIHPLIDNHIAYHLDWTTLRGYQNWEYIPPVAYFDNPDYAHNCIRGAYTLQSIGMLPNLPDGADFTQTTTYDWDFSADTTTSNGAFFYGKPRLKRMYVTIPPKNITMNGNGYWTKGIHLTADNWTYIAQHAPSVSDKTITIDAANESLMGSTNKSTLQSKGWTITVI